MGAFDSYPDAPGQIKSEGQTITLKFEQGVPQLTQGTVSWNIPIPGNDCATSNDRIGAYSGIVVLLSTTPLSTENIPVNGVVYNGDPTADPDIHVGDTIGGAYVVGAFYETEKKNRGEELTTGFIISNLQSDTPYYIAAYAADSQYRYHQEGVRAYSADIQKGGATKDTPAVQKIKIGGSAVLPTDGTGLIPGINYQFDIIYQSEYPRKDCTDRMFRITINGSNAGTFEQLVDELNKQFNLLANPPQSPVAPGSNTLYWDGDKLYKFDGTSLVHQINVVIETTDPTDIETGEYWFKRSTNQLRIRGGSPAQWNTATVINFGNVDPTSLSVNDHWYAGGSNGYTWNGTTWCQIPTDYVFSTETDPSCPPADLGGAYWYNSTEFKLYNWDIDSNSWVAKSAIYWDVAPTEIPTGTLWYNLTEDTLNVLESGSPIQWTATAVTIDEDQPTSPTLNQYWFNPETEELQKYVGAPIGWQTQNVIVWPVDPTDPSSCNLWWDSVNDLLMVWDVITSQWVEVFAFYQQATDPSLPPVLPAGSLWFKPSTQVVLRWDGAAWQEIDVVISSTDPRSPNTGDHWYKSSTDTWYVWNGSWSAIEVIESEYDPTSLPVGTYWINPGSPSTTISVWNGIGWVNVSFTTTPPYPNKRDLWFNTTDGNMYEWNGSKWIDAQKLIYAQLGSQCNANGYLVLTTGAAGAGLNLRVLEPGANYEEVFAKQANEAIISTVDVNAYLFGHIVRGATLVPQERGTDGLSDKPTTLELGVGTDGTPEERRALYDAIKYQLGYPVVDVELTKDQLDRAVQNALDQYRTRSSGAYRRGFYFLDARPGYQQYQLTNKKLGYHKIVTVTNLHRFTSAFLSSAHGAGVYGQVVLQHLYNMGTYDLTSYFLVSQYIEQLEQLFATRLTFTWNESNRVLTIYNSFSRAERILMEATLERTEQDLLQDRWAKNWIREWALAESMMMLAQSRGKFSTLPGAGGGTALNAGDLKTGADTIFDRLLKEIDDLTVQNIEEFGLGGDIVIG